MSRKLKASDIARRHGVDRETAYLWLEQLEKKYGPSVVGRRGKRGVLFTTEAAMAKVTPVAPVEGRDDRRFAELAERLEEAETRTDTLTRMVSASHSGLITRATAQTRNDAPTARV